MAIPKVCGIETEYGVALRGAADANPVLASSMLINGYVEHHRVGWDFEDESPGRDARGFAREGAQPPEIETHLVNTVLTNGARYYVDHAHPEYSTPECSDALELVLADKAGERILARSMHAARRLLGPGQEIVVYKNNSDGKGNSLRHATRTTSSTAAVPVRDAGAQPAAVVRHAARCSPARARSAPRTAPTPVDYQISQRADFFEEEVGLETTLKRPIVNTRDEPHADPQKYRRLHVIVGDANLCEVATFLKVGTTAIVLAMIEDDFIDKDLSIVGPVPAMRTVSHDPTCRATVELADGGRCTAVELQWEFLRLAQKYADETGLEVCGGDDVGGQVLDRWEAVLAALERDPLVARRPARLGHEARPARRVRRRATASSGTTRSSRCSTCSTTTCGPTGRSTSGWCAPARSSAWSTRTTCIAAMTEPPGDDPGVLPGRCLARWPDAVVAANWDSLILDVGADPLRRIPMMEPLTGHARRTSSALFERWRPPAELWSAARLTATVSEEYVEHARA